MRNVRGLSNTTALMYGLFGMNNVKRTHRDKMAMIYVREKIIFCDIGSQYMPKGEFSRADDAYGVIVRCVYQSDRSVMRCENRVVVIYERINYSYDVRFWLCERLYRPDGPLLMQGSAPKILISTIKGTFVIIQALSMVGTFIGMSVMG